MKRWLLALLLLIGCAAAPLPPPPHPPAPKVAVHWSENMRPAVVAISDRLPDNCQAAIFEAVTWWGNHGVPWLLPIVAPDTFVVAHPVAFMTMQYDLPEDLGDAGFTRSWTMPDGRIISSETWLRHDLCLWRTVAHEIGHALGLDDLRSPWDQNNLMYFNTSGGEELSPAQLEQIR